MAKNKGGKKAVWMYAIILFTSAFIVLLLTAYSQIKFNKNIDKFRDQISSDEKVKIDYQTNLNSTTEENKNLKNKINDLNTSITSLNQKLNDTEKILKSTQDKNTKQLEAYDLLLKAESLADEGNYKECMNILRNVLDNSYLGDAGKKKYENLLKEIIKPASLQYYQSGYKYYSSNNYKEAKIDLELSLLLAENEYYSDDCLFLLAYTEYQLGNKEISKKLLDDLVKRYPMNTYENDIRHLLKKL